MKLAVIGFSGSIIVADRIFYRIEPARDYLRWLKSRGFTGEILEL